MCRVLQCIIILHAKLTWKWPLKWCVCVCVCVHVCGGVRRGLCVDKLGTCQFDRESSPAKALTDVSEGT